MCGGVAVYARGFDRVPHLQNPLAAPTLTFGDPDPGAGKIETRPRDRKKELSRQPSFPPSLRQHELDQVQRVIALRSKEPIRPAISQPLVGTPLVNELSSTTAAALCQVLEQNDGWKCRCRELRSSVDVLRRANSALRCERPVFKPPKVTRNALVADTCTNLAQRSDHCHRRASRIVRPQPGAERRWSMAHRYVILRTTQSDRPA